MNTNQQRKALNTLARGGNTEALRLLLGQLNRPLSGFRVSQTETYIIQAINAVQGSRTHLPAARLACKNGHLECLKLLESGIKEYDWEDLIDRAVKGNHSGILDWIAEKSPQSLQYRAQVFLAPARPTFLQQIVPHLPRKNINELLALAVVYRSTQSQEVLFPCADLNWVEQYLRQNPFLCNSEKLDAFVQRKEEYEAQRQNALLQECVEQSTRLIQPRKI